MAALPPSLNPRCIPDISARALSEIRNERILLQASARSLCARAYGYFAQAQEASNTGKHETAYFYYLKCGLIIEEVPTRKDFYKWKEKNDDSLNDYLIVRSVTRDRIRKLAKLLAQPSSDAGSDKASLQSFKDPSGLDDQPQTRSAEEQGIALLCFFPTKVIYPRLSQRDVPDAWIVTSASNDSDNGSIYRNRLRDATERQRTSQTSSNSSADDHLLQRFEKLSIKKHEPNNVDLKGSQVLPLNSTDSNVVFNCLPRSSLENFKNYNLSEISSITQTPLQARHPISNADPPSAAHDHSISDFWEEEPHIPALLPDKFAQTNVITVAILHSYLFDRSPKPSILFIDVRDRKLFEKSRIRGQHVVNVEPIILSEGITGPELEKALCLATRREQYLFSSRSQFDIVVYYDQSSRINQVTGGPLDEEHARILHTLAQAIFEYNGYLKPLKRMPLFLLGGLDRWIAHIGEDGLDRTLLPTKEYRSELPSTLSDGQELQPSNVREPRRYTLEQDLPTGVEIDLDAEIKWLQQLQTEKAGELEQTPSNDYRPNKKKIHRAASIIPSSDSGYARTITDYLQQPNGISSPCVVDSDNGYHSIYTANKTEDHPVSPTSLDWHPSGPNRVLQRSRTILDHPFHGFSKLQDVRSNEETPSAEIPLTATDMGNSPRPKADSLPPKVPEKRRMNSLQSRQPSSTLPAINTGLKNLGNSCYMNAVLQCLSGSVPLSRYYNDGSFRREIARNNPLGSQGKLSEAYTNVLKHLWSSNYTFVSPVTFRDLIGRMNSQFGNDDQQDASEFLSFLLDALHEDTNLAFDRSKFRELTKDEEDRRNGLPIQVVSPIEWSRYTHRNSSRIVSFFQGQLLSQLNAFSMLSLPLALNAHHGKSSIYDCLGMFLQPEILRGENSWLCPKCKKPREASKQLMITRLPPLLIIHLKRFSMNGRWRDKLNMPVEVPLQTLDLSPYVVPEANSTHGHDSLGTLETVCYGMIIHHGQGLTSGHYTAYVLDESNQWWHFDDTRVSKVSEEEVFKAQAYIVFYKRKAMV
ncbi:Ubiquitin carboxyl-terminal hydrolase 8 [Neolecta irregularis DAH-3]|uniref:ubiquitinyl hydrolase 1 n=1 Tax=Neolecta irregularis (strain DAH-3) TaxID=1198029 RepID=A0A1U7LVW2_NEOID|nr:Ubiquitin carboxyl-terminal hydrolase 8 [Neolecta irregularis DAH-3]|eukprot:OLL26651.1 Ubiquitin carboxyl-terminal hydrolase 8 [Neolecta irregularis DAH-3]